MKTMTIAVMILCISCSVSKKKSDKVVTELKVESISNADKVVALLKSIETGAREPAAYINPEKYIQHNQGVADGLEGFGDILGQLMEAASQNPDLKPKVNTVRVLHDGDYVITHTAYNFFGPKVGFDIFRFEDGLIVEHWDNLQETVFETVSGRSMTDGPTVVEDLDKTEMNKLLVQNLLRDVFLGEAPSKITEYISTVQYDQHNPHVGDGLAALGEALKAMADAGTPMMYKTVHKVLGEGNFVLSVCEGVFMGERVSFYDLFRVKDGLVVEHWDVVQKLIPEDEAANKNGKFNFPE